MALVDLQESEPYRSKDLTFVLKMRSLVFLYITLDFQTWLRPIKAAHFFSTLAVISLWKTANTTVSPQSAVLIKVHNVKLCKYNARRLLDDTPKQKKQKG